MNKHLKLFANHSAYSQAESNLDKPNVAVCLLEGDVHYNPYVDPYSGHEYVEIGGIKWATMNIGAENVTDAGLYFQWGDTQGYTASQVGSGEGKKYFDWSDYKYCNGTSSVMTKYNSSDNKVVLDLSDDAAYTNWGENWKTPSESDWDNLKYNTTATWTDDYQNTGVKGTILVSKTDSSKILFFPIGGKAVYGSILSDLTGNCLSSSLDEDTEIIYSKVSRKDVIDKEYDIRCNGYNVRPIAIN